jgi:hypothetical protein
VLESVREGQVPAARHGVCTHGAGRQVHTAYVQAAAEGRKHDYMASAAAWVGVGDALRRGGVRGGADAVGRSACGVVLQVIQLP